MRLDRTDDQVAERREGEPHADSEQRATDQDVVRVPVLYRGPDESNPCDR